MFSLSELLDKWSLEKPNEIAFSDENREVTFVELNTYARKIATLLSQSGVSRGDLVCTFMPTYPGWIFTLALHFLGAVTMTKGSEEFASLDAQPDWFICLKADPNFPSDRTFVFNEEYLALINASPEMKNLPGYSSSSDIARLIGTSGTSGDKKFIELSVDGLSRLTTQTSANDFAGNDHIMCLFPFGGRVSYRHSLQCLYFGKPLLSWSHSGFQLTPAFTKYPVRTLLGSPVQVAGFLDLQFKNNLSLNHLETIIMAGSTPSQSFVNQLHMPPGCKVFVAYGSTEAGNVSMKEITHGIEPGANINPEVNVQIVDENNQLLSNNSVGLIRYKRSGMATSYYNNPQATQAFFKDGYFYPGDLGSVNDQGQIVLAGRADEVINLGGVKLNPATLDSIVHAQPEVLDGACFAVQGALGIDELAITVVVTENFDKKAFVEAFSKAATSRPRIIIQTSALARNENGKVDRMKLQTIFATQIADQQMGLSN